MQQSLNKIQGQTIAVYLNWILSKKYRQRIHGKINSMFRTPEHRLIFSTSHALENQCEFSRVKLYRNDLKGNKNYFELAGGLSYRWYLSLICVLSSCELPRVNYSKCMKEIQRKSILVRVSEKVLDIRSLLYIGNKKMILNFHIVINLSRCTGGTLLQLITHCNSFFFLINQHRTIRDICLKWTMTNSGDWKECPVLFMRSKF